MHIRREQKLPPKLDTLDYEDDPSLPGDTGPSVPSGFLDQSFKRRPVSSYLSLREQGPSGLRQLYSAHFVMVAHNALKKGAKTENRGMDIIAHLVEDAIIICKSQSATRGRIIIAELLRRLTRLGVLTKRQVLSLLQTLQASDQLRFVSVGTRVAIVRWIVTYEPDRALDRELFPLIGWWLVGCLPTADIPGAQWPPYLWEKSSSEVLTPRVVWPLFRVILCLAQDGNRNDASALLSKLVAARRIDPDAIDATDLSHKDYVYVILSVLVRTCLMHGWFARASTLLVPTMSARQTISVPLALLVEDWIVAALVDPRSQDLKEAASMLSLLFQRAENYVVPDLLLQQFYEATFQLDLPELARTVYRQSRNIEGRSYPPPRDHILVWFMRYLQKECRDVHLARILAKHVTDDDIYVAPQNRASFIVYVTEFGFTSQGRALWERYSTGPDRLYVVGRRAVMLRLVSAFVKAEDIAMRAVRRRWPTAYAAPLRKNLEDEAAERADDQEEDVQRTGQDDRAGEDLHPASDAPHPPSPPPPHGIENANVASSAAPDLPALAEDVPIVRKGLGFATLTHSELLERARDLRLFAERVFDAFYESKQPLSSADHYGLNALARGAFVLGRDALAFEVFNVMKQRRIILDMYDINVALSAVAKSDPAAGVARIQRIVDSGFKPDAVTFGTVIHWAIYHGDAPLVGELIRLARESGLENFSFKTMGSLLHATVSSEFGSLAAPASQASNARDIVDTMLDAGILPTPNMGRDCVHAALRADDPVMAFRFWKELLSGKVEWGDPAQKALRMRIAGQVREHHCAGWLDEKRSAAMLSELGDYGEFSLYLRQLNAAQQVVGR